MREVAVFFVDIEGCARLRGRSGERRGYATTGPVTNVAARLAALAKNGKILTTRATSELRPPGCERRRWSRSP